MCERLLAGSSKFWYLRQHLSRTKFQTKWKKKRVQENNVEEIWPFQRLAKDYRYWLLVGGVGCKLGEVVDHFQWQSLFNIVEDKQFLPTPSQCFFTGCQTILKQTVCCLASWTSLLLGDRATGKRPKLYNGPITDQLHAWHKHYQWYHHIDVNILWVMNLEDWLEY